MKNTSYLVQFSEQPPIKVTRERVAYLVKAARSRHVLFLKNAQRNCVKGFYIRDCDVKIIPA